MPRLRLRPRGLILGISFGREPSNSTDGTFTRVASGFPGALLNSAVEGMRDQQIHFYSSSRIPLRNAGQFLNARNGVGHQVNLVEDIIPDVLLCAITFEN